ncbi:baseplate hub assembly catalyst [Cyanophage S-RIM4]|nr:baseplate hub assembly catalyst [Cyanophage S-RIM4]
MHHHKWDMEYIDNLIPFEKEIYMSLLIQFLKEEERRIKERQVG